MVVRRDKAEIGNSVQNERVRCTLRGTRVSKMEIPIKRTETKGDVRGCLCRSGPCMHGLG
jgi:hypothetical protein